MGLNVAVAAYRGVNVQIHHALSGMTLYIGPMTGLARNPFVRVGAFDRVKIRCVTTQTRALLSPRLLAAGQMLWLVYV